MFSGLMAGPTPPSATGAPLSTTCHSTPSAWYGGGARAGLLSNVASSFFFLSFEMNSQMLRFSYKQSTPLVWDSVGCAKQARWAVRQLQQLRDLDRFIQDMLSSLDPPRKRPRLTASSANTSSRSATYGLVGGSIDRPRSNDQHFKLKISISHWHEIRPKTRSKKGTIKLSGRPT